MKKEVHLRIEEDIYNKIKDRADKSNISVNQQCKNLFENSLLYEELLSKINIMMAIINNLDKNTRYTKQLLIQTYSDIDVEPTDPNKSDNLKKFNKNFRKTRFND